MDIRTDRALLGGVLGTVAMTVVGLWVAPLMALPAMNPAVMLAGAMGGNMLLGWIGHFAIGIVLAFTYAAVASAIPGSPGVRGALFGLAPFLLAQIAVMPLMGMPFFSGSVPMVLGSLVGHLVYGAVVGVVYGAVGRSAEN